MKTEESMRKQKLAGKDHDDGEKNLGISMGVGKIAQMI